MTTIPLLSWSGEESFLTVGEQIDQLEEGLSVESIPAITTHSVQLAIQMCIEVMGSRTHMIPCILPINAPPSTLSAVLRAGAQPILLDINGGSLQLDVETLQEALEELESAVVVLTRPGGSPVDETLLAAVQDVPTVLDSRLVPYPPKPEELVASFNVYDLTQVIGSGGVIYHGWENQRKMLRLMRDGILGHDGAPSRQAAGLAQFKLANAQAHKSRCESIRDRLRSELLIHQDRGIIPWEQTDGGLTPLLVFVPNNAKRVVAQLRSYGIEAAQAVLPLHFLSEVRQRFREIPEYPVAEQVTKQVIALPVHVGVEDEEKRIANIIAEVAGG